MALETVVYPQDQFVYLSKDFYGYDEFSLELDSKMEHGQNGNNWDSSSSSQELQVEAPPPAPARRKRRRNKSTKNKEEMEKQRMTHIAVERNRRKQMNEYLALMRSLMPASYVQRGDQASIIGGAINFVKELEHHLHTLEAQCKTTSTTTEPVIFSNLFTYPQYSSSGVSGSGTSTGGPIRWGYGDIEVTTVESHANVKIFSKKRPAQLLKIVAGLQCLRLNLLHLNITTVDQMVLYSLSVKIEDGCQVTTVDEIANAVNHLLGRIEEEAAAAALR